jgi:hypothetical protein
MTITPLSPVLATPPSIPVDAATATTPILGDAEPHRWSLATRIGFRIAFCYFVAYCLTNGNSTVWDSIPVLGGKVAGWLQDIVEYPGPYLSQHIFHVAPPGNNFHNTQGAADYAIAWIANFVRLVGSVLAATVWSLLDRHRPHYQTLSAWLRFLIRLTLGFGMVTYAMMKIFPMQMPVPSIMWLSEPTGMHPPMTMLWMLIGSTPVCEIICGSAELLAGILILFRRTALLGTLLTAFVMSNVLLYNLCFDVPVKIYAIHMLLLALFVTLPDIRQLFRFFWLHQPAASSGVWVPPATWPWFRPTTIAIEIVFAILTVGNVTYKTFNRWRPVHAARIAPCPLRGAWRIDSATVTDASGARIAHAVLSNDKKPFVELDIDTATRAAFKDDSGKFSYVPTKTDIGKQTLQFTRPDKSTITYTTATPEPGHLILTPTGGEEKSAQTMSLTLVSPPDGYPLMTRGFHWVNEYPYQR